LRIFLRKPFFGERMAAELLSDLLPFVLAAVTIYWLHRRHEKKRIDKQKRAQPTPPIPPDEPETDEPENMEEDDEDAGPDEDSEHDEDSGQDKPS
jgi:hypothetical protein